MLCKRIDVSSVRSLLTQPGVHASILTELEDSRGSLSMWTKLGAYLAVGLGSDGTIASESQLQGSSVQGSKEGQATDPVGSGPDGVRPCGVKAQLDAPQSDVATAGEGRARVRHRGSLLSCFICGT
jgi:hypothetical protein